jgi:hypothetical protein
MNKLDNYMAASQDYAKALQEADAIFIKKREDLWNSFTKDEQIELFCHVTSKLKKAELDDRRSYRGVLYSEFGFGPEAYGAAQLSGFLELHNCIYPDGLEEIENIQSALKLFGIEATEEEILERIENSKKASSTPAQESVKQYPLPGDEDSID